MPIKFTSEQFWKLYPKLPQDLKDALFADDTGDNIFETCERNGATNKLKEIVELVGRVLTGLMPAEDFQQALEAEVKIKKDVAKKIAQEINRFIFFSVKESLAALYNVGAVPTAQKPAASVATPNANPVSEKIESTQSTEDKPKIKPGIKTKRQATAKSGSDRYREPIDL